MSDNFLSLSDVMDRTGGLSEPTIRRLIRAGDFPGSLPITQGRKGWIASEVQAWVDARIEAGKTARLKAAKARKEAARHVIA